MGHNRAQYVTTAACGKKKNSIPAIQIIGCVEPCLAAIPAQLTPTISRICIGTRSRSRSSFFRP